MADFLDVMAWTGDDVRQVLVNVEQIVTAQVGTRRAAAGAEPRPVVSLVLVGREYPLALDPALNGYSSDDAAGAAALLERLAKILGAAQPTPADPEDPF